MQCSFRGLRAAGKETAVMARPSKYTPEFRRRAVEEVLDREPDGDRGRELVVDHDT